MQQNISVWPLTPQRYVWQIENPVYDCGRFNRWCVWNDQQKCELFWFLIRKIWFLIRECFENYVEQDRNSDPRRSGEYVSYLVPHYAGKIFAQASCSASVLSSDSNIFDLLTHQIVVRKPDIPKPGTVYLSVYKEVCLILYWLLNKTLLFRIVPISPTFSRASCWTAVIAVFCRLLLLHRSWLYRDSGEAGGLKTSSSMQLRRRAYLSSLWVLQVIYRAISAPQYMPCVSSMTPTVLLSSHL